MQSTKEFSVKERIIRMKNKLDTEVDERMGGERLEVACIMFAAFDIGLRIKFVCIALFGTDATVLWLTGASSESEEFIYYILIIVRPALLIDSIIRIVFSVCLVVAVKKHNVCLMRVCFIYGVVVLSLALLALIPNLLTTLTGNFTGFGRLVLSLVSKVFVAIKVLVLYKTYMKFKHDDELEQLVNMTNTDDKQNAPAADYDCDKVFYKTVA